MRVLFLASSEYNGSIFMDMKRMLLALVIVLIVANLFLWGYTANVKKELSLARAQATQASYNAKVISFMQLFIEKVLKSEKEVSFDDRLALENAVRELQDESIVTAWNAFVQSKTELDAQSAVKDLLSVLTSKIVVR